MDEQQPTQQINMSQANHNHKVLYVSLGLLLGAIVLLLLVVFVMYPQTKKPVITSQTQENTQAIDKTSKVEPTQTVMPVTVNSKEDLTTQQKALDNTDLTAITAGLDQNTNDASQFSQ